MRAFTLIEVLVVVAIIALLVSVLLPSLSRARESARTSQCLAQLKQFGYGLTMYTNDNKSKLPGPSHMTISQDTARLWKPQGTLGEQWFKMNMPYYLSKYMGDKLAKNVDKLAVCPTAARIPVASPGSQAWYYQAKSHYIVNTGGGTAANGTKPTTGQPRQYPYYSTNPPNYFGYQNVGDPAPETYKGADRYLREPKKMEVIKNPGREWAIADLWWWQVNGKQVGTWPFALAANTSIGNQAGKLKVPSYPYHQTVADYDPQGTDKTDPRSPRLLSGKTNTVHMDGHGESMLLWKGSNNPCWDSNSDLTCD